MNKKKRLMFGMFIIVILLGFLALTSGVTSNQYEVSDAVSEKDSLGDKTILINGSIVAESDKWDAVNRTFTFKLTDGKTTIDVIYTGSKPDIPPESVNIQAVVTGKFNNDVFEAYKMITKCPSKYEAEL